MACPDPSPPAGGVAGMGRSEVEAKLQRQEAKSKSKCDDDDDDDEGATLAQLAAYCAPACGLPRRGGVAGGPDTRAP